MVINSGDDEIIGIRHRETQTLYISDILVPSKPGPPGIGYGLIQVGIYICSLLDAMDRARQLREDEKKNKSGPAVSTDHSESAAPDEVPDNDYNYDASVDRASHAGGSRRGGFGATITPKAPDNRALSLEAVSSQTLFTSLN